MSTTILTSRDGAVARITLNRPERRNALTGEMLAALGTAFAAAARDESVRAILLTGAAGAFCAGQDLAERDPRGRTEPFDLARTQRDLYHPLIRAMRDCATPVIAAVPGVAAGAGVGIALAADIVLAGETARLALSFVRVGLAVDAGTGWLLAGALGPARARALLMTGASLTGAEAAAAGLIWRAVPDAMVEAEAASLAAELADAPRTALAMIKRAVAATHLPLEDYLETEAEAQGTAGRDPDYAEGVLAFLEKRPPRWC